MRITDELDVTLRNNGFLVITSAIHGRIAYAPTDNDYNQLLDFYNEARPLCGNDRENFYNANKQRIDFVFGGTAVNGATFVTVEISPEEKVEHALNGLLDFFSEFSFTPNFRFVNTLALMLHNGSANKAKSYVTNYFRLIDSPYAVEVKQKMRSDEFSAILKDLGAVAPTESINNRFKIYFGDAGTGKTTIAQSECENRCVVCNNSMLPSDLMEDFVFDGGKPSFKPSVLWECMEQGKPLVLDEMNLLPFDSLRFLQGVLDNKAEFTYKGHKVTIANGFQIIATMNLVVNGAVFNLPEPLVDRSAEIKEFKLTAKQLTKAIIKGE